jgi:serine protease 16
VLNFYGYNDVVAASMAAPIVGGSSACASAIKSAFQTVGSMLQSEAGIEDLSTMFNVCPHTPLKFKENQAVFVETLSGMWM